MSSLIDDISSQFDRLPPHDVGAERSVLAASLMSPAILTECRGILGRDDFFQADHQIIWDALTHLRDAGKPADLVAVGTHLAGRQQLAEVGGAGYLAEVWSSLPSAETGPHYARIVKNKAVLRRLITAGNDILREAYGPEDREESGPALAMKFAGLLGEIGAGGTADSFQSLGFLATVVLDHLMEGKPKRIPTGIQDLDAVIGGLPIRGFSMIAARPGMGKSALGKRLAENYGRAGLPVAVISVEEDAENIAGNMISTRSGVENSRIANGNLQDRDYAEVGRAIEELSPLPVFFNDRPVKLSEVEAAIGLARFKYKAEVVIVDYLQLIDDELGTDNENRQVTEISRRLKAAFKRAGVIGIAMVQLNRGKEFQKVPDAPSLNNLRGSGSLEQDGDVILALHGEDYYRRKDAALPISHSDHYTIQHRIQVHVLKNKNGPLGVVPLYCNMATLDIRDRTPEERLMDGQSNGGSDDPFP